MLTVAVLSRSWDTQALRQDSFTNFRTMLLLQRMRRVVLKWMMNHDESRISHVNWQEVANVLMIELYWIVTFRWPRFNRKRQCILASSSAWRSLSLTETPRISHSSSSSDRGKASQKSDSETRCLRRSWQKASNYVSTTLYKAALWFNDPNWFQMFQEQVA